MSTSSSSISFDVNEFTAKRVLVTGGTKGAGKAIADRFRRGGATVIITARSAPEDKTENHFIQADLSTPEGTTKVSKQILDTFKGVDIVIQKRTKNERKTITQCLGNQIPIAYRYRFERKNILNGWIITSHSRRQDDFAHSQSEEIRARR